MRKYDKEFREAHPETIGETDSHFDVSNYADWLENRLEELERKAWECSVEMMDESFKNSEKSDNPECARKERYNGLAAGYKYAAYKLRASFGFPKSETPEKFKK